MSDLSDYIRWQESGRQMRAKDKQDKLTEALQRVESLEQENTRLRSALVNTAPREDGDGLPCWCLEDGPERYLKSGLFQIEHKGYCVNARAALNPETREVQNGG